MLIYFNCTIFVRFSSELIIGDKMRKYNTVPGYSSDFIVILYVIRFGLLFLAFCFLHFVFALLFLVFCFWSFVFTLRFYPYFQYLANYFYIVLQFRVCIFFAEMQLTKEHVMTALGLDRRTFDDWVRKGNFVCKGNGKPRPARLELVSTYVKTNWKQLFGTNFSDVIGFDEQRFSRNIGRLLKGRPGPFPIVSIPERQKLDMSCKFNQNIHSIISTYPISHISNIQYNFLYFQY